MKKNALLATAFVAGALFVSPVTSAYAASAPSAPISSLNTPVPVHSQTNVSGMNPNATTPPTQWWNLNASPGVRTGIYTNYFFTPPSSGTLYLNQTVNGTAGQEFVVELLDYTEGGAIVYSNVVADNTSTTITWPYLNTAHHYEVWWAPENSNYPISGSFEVYE
ncbi:hypothetical protein GCM10025857_26190 [Alicyclobacillus contaminans]|uniref:hypothetical protein n=1 Tax=Alicyclobacillus contaminans TaxID=392016 RepID=UPI0012EBD7F2|nr:hypothetical protein [Alicyclobacillus contaminans]GMA51262.1 hypothetical protein GCM10025857_26190 [Alicyclobacillus contaminans]